MLHLTFPRSLVAHSTRAYYLYIHLESLAFQFLESSTLGQYSPLMDKGSAKWVSQLMLLYPPVISSLGYPWYTPRRKERALDRPPKVNNRTVRLPHFPIYLLTPPCSPELVDWRLCLSYWVSISTYHPARGTRGESSFWDGVCFSFPPARWLWFSGHGPVDGIIYYACRCTRDFCYRQ